MKYAIEYYRGDDVAYVVSETQLTPIKRFAKEFNTFEEASAFIDKLISLYPKELSHVEYTGDMVVKPYVLTREDIEEF